MHKGKQRHIQLNDHEEEGTYCGSNKYEEEGTYYGSKNYGEEITLLTITYDFIYGQTLITIKYSIT